MPSKQFCPSAEKIASLRRKVLRFYRQHGRKLPFRETSDPYQITVAEIMLQQTQVDRVVPYWQRWIKRWPSWHSLAKASNGDLLAMWSGLGYNHRAIYLGKMARAIEEEHGGRLPRDLEALLALPGIGPYTSRAILIFAFNEPLVTIDTNIRKVILFELSLAADTSEAKLEEIAGQLLPRGKSRDWHNAMMDYATLALPRRIAHLPASSSQSRFEGSVRQIRGEIIRRLVTGEHVTVKTLRQAIGRSSEDIERAVKSLVDEGMILKRQSGALRLS